MQTNLLLGVSRAGILLGCVAENVRIIKLPSVLSFLPFALLPLLLLNPFVEFLKHLYLYVWLGLHLGQRAGVIEREEAEQIHVLAVLRDAPLHFRLQYNSA